MYSLFGQDFIFRLIAIVVGLVIHEFAHAWTALLLGDKTAKHQGRVTLNPVAHLEPIGLLMILFGPFGWARPVQINASNFKNPRVGTALVAFAGPVSNLLLAVVSLLLFRPYMNFNMGFMPQLLWWSFVVNVSLFIFNLIPVPPLDGSRIVYSFLPYRWEFQYRKLELYAPLIMLLLVMLPQTRNAIFGTLLNAVAGWLANLILGF
ncbi:zinc metalloprotease [Alicyclobacillus contaminans]|uniref:site-2 protease family protein n=1 Tax=Alicyclobacillus contaminans TaxID=392016 RepID=UPI0004022EC7|nr:site-2 protease family protein [Alicyclobacillus contaminans]GMA52471.1 zinc metalloprotease [Alicyclobacillus contaminans]